MRATAHTVGSQAAGRMQHHSRSVALHAQELLFTSKKAIFQPPKAIRYGSSCSGTQGIAGSMHAHSP